MTSYTIIRNKKAFRLLLFAGMILPFCTGAQSLKGVMMVIHGGAGNILPSQMTPDQENRFIQALTLALQRGYDTLKSGATSVDAVQAAIHVMEDNPLFNAGKGSVFTHAGTNEMDAAIMDGSNLRAGAVAEVTTIRNPIDAARAVMEKSKHVMLVGAGAEQFAARAGVRIVDRSYFFTPERWRQLQQARAQDSLQAARGDTSSTSRLGRDNPDFKFGTVGAVALDDSGHLAAGTSTGGMTDKMFGRVGDSPIIGAGTYANDATCAISCTGWGEYFIRSVAAKTVSDLMEYKGMSAVAAGHALIDTIIPRMGGDGGMILLDAQGNGCMVFDTPGMFRGVVTRDGHIQVWMYR
jgi:beta-aspartyl-peptidase (threonine type)